MRIPSVLTFGLCTVFFGMAQVNAQDVTSVDSKEPKVQKHTIMEQFEPELMGTAENRIDLKKKRIALAEHRRSVLDTLDISDRKRRKLMWDLENSPYSDCLNRTMADIKFEDIEE